jgi:hypothetical protein
MCSHALVARSPMYEYTVPVAPIVANAGPKAATRLSNSAWLQGAGKVIPTRHTREANSARPRQAHEMLATCGCIAMDQCFVCGVEQTP